MVVGRKCVSVFVVGLEVFGGCYGCGFGRSFNCGMLWLVVWMGEWKVN